MTRDLHILILLFLIQSFASAQTDSSYSFIVAGHAYGSHDADNLGLHPALLQSLHIAYDSATVFIVLTGDIVNHSTAESWQQVEEELDSISLLSYYVMGNHDSNEAGIAVFDEKFGGSYYSWYFGNDLFIALNSIEADRAISGRQLDFLREQINRAGDTTRNIFIFFHEILWNSHQKYVEVRSNSRSRYDQVVNYSNYWDEVHPMLMEYDDKRFFLIAGDVGGNPDAIAAFYDRWGHITLLASGMGEVSDENYLLVKVSDKDSVQFELVALDSSLELPGIEFYSIPPAPSAIMGPALVNPGDKELEYTVEEVSNADSYLWELPTGATGSSTSHRIKLDFDDDFMEDSLSVQAEKDGYGKGPQTSMIITAAATPINERSSVLNEIQLNIVETRAHLDIELNGAENGQMTLRFFDSTGRILLIKKLDISSNYTEIQIEKETLPEGVVMLSASSATQSVSRKILLRR